MKKNAGPRGGSRCTEVLPYIAGTMNVLYRTFYATKNGPGRRQRNVIHNTQIENVLCLYALLARVCFRREVSLILGFGLFSNFCVIRVFDFKLYGRGGRVAIFGG